MMYCFGRKLKISLFGRSHAECVGCIIEGLPVGMSVDIDAVKRKMEQRKPQSFGTERKEKDEVVFGHGLENGTVTDRYVLLTIANLDTDASAYEEFKFKPRPGHADLPASARGYDISGGGQFSGRMTAPLVAAGAIAEQYLSAKGVKIAAYSKSIGKISDVGRSFDEISCRMYGTRAAVSEIDMKFRKEIESAKNCGDSVGGIAECIVRGLPLGFGGCRFDSLDALISRAMLSIPGVKGVEFGDGFALSAMRGSESNDGYRIEDGKITVGSNHMGGVLGGMSDGADLVFRVAVKPTPSIFKEQKTVDIREMRETTLSAKGRHDACIVPRIVPVVESMAAIVIADGFLSE